LTADASVRARDFEYVDALVVQVASQTGAVGPGSLDANLGELALAAHPGQQCCVTGWCGTEFGVVDQSPVEVDDRGVMCGGVGVNASDDGPLLAAMYRLFLSVPAGRRTKRVDRPVMGRARARFYKVTPFRSEARFLCGGAPA
jgi:hypothetical protein